MSRQRWERGEAETQPFGAEWLRTGEVAMVGGRLWMEAVASGGLVMGPGVTKGRAGLAGKVGV